MILRTLLRRHTVALSIGIIMVTVFCAWIAYTSIGRHERYAILIVLLGFGVIMQMAGRHLSRYAKHVWHTIHQQFAPFCKAVSKSFTED